MIPKELLRSLGWDDDLIGSFERAPEIREDRSMAGSSLGEVSYDISSSHASTVDLRGRPTDAAPTLCIEFKN
jgi:hypothetical protein